jgi:hypothetical protein
MGGGGSGGAGEAAGTGGAAGGVTGNACADSVAKFCTRIQDCEPGDFALSGFTGLADCVAFFRPPCDDALAAPHTGETAALVQQCGDGLAAQSCADVVQGKIVPACIARGGTIAAGGSCNNDWQCASGRCWAPFADMCGTCATVASADQPCQVDADFGAVCPKDLLCAHTLASGTTPVCTSRVAMGDGCAETQVCPANAYCDPTTQVCTQLPALGQACDPTAVYDCDPTQAAATCDGVMSLCVPVAAAPVGQACGTVNGTETRCDGACALGDAGVGVCHGFLARGQTCTDFDLCSFDTVCTGGICTSATCGGAGSSAHDAAVAARSSHGTGLLGAVPRRFRSARPW